MCSFDRKSVLYYQENSIFSPKKQLKTNVIADASFTYQFWLVWNNLNLKWIYHQEIDPILSLKNQSLWYSLTHYISRINWIIPVQYAAP